MSHSVSSAGSKREYAIALSDDEDDQLNQTHTSTPNDGSDSGDDDDLVTELTPEEVQNFRERLDDDVVTELTPEEARDLKERLAQQQRGIRLLDSFTTSSGVIVELNQCYELHAEDDSDYGPFLLVKSIHSSNLEVVIQGILMERHFNVHVGRNKSGKGHAILPLAKNELCMHLRTTVGKIGHSHNSECRVDISPSRIMGPRRVVFTNYGKTEDGIYAFNYQTEGLSVIDEKSRRYVEEHGVLCCRWKLTEEIDIQRRKVVAWQLAPLSNDECDPSKSINRIAMRRQYGNQTRQAQHRENPNSERHNESTESMSTLRRTLRYLFGDACAGGGGVLRGAEKAGLKLHWALDSWDVAIRTIRMNFPQIDQLIHQRLENLQDPEVVRTLFSLVVDILHVSFPCQGHSWMNRGTNPERDATNNALIMSLEHLLKFCRPRIITMEQTDGILTKNDGFYVNKVIQQLTAAGYGVRWKVCNMRQHRVPSARKRLMILGFCPGENMPNWPQPTGQMSVGEAIRGIPFHQTMHNIEEQREKYRQHRYNLPVIDVNQPLNHTIKTNGVQGLLRDRGELYKPTIRQSMRLMSFPDEHVLYFRTQADYNTQIGNAVPPVFMEQLFLEVIKTLEKSDEEARIVNQGLEVLTVDD